MSSANFILGRQTQLKACYLHGGDKGSRTPDLLLARQALSQLSYAPMGKFRTRVLKIE